MAYAIETLIKNKLDFMTNTTLPEEINKLNTALSRVEELEEKASSSSDESSGGGLTSSEEYELNDLVNNKIPTYRSNIEKINNTINMLKLEWNFIRRLIIIGMDEYAPESSEDKVNLENFVQIISKKQDISDLPMYVRMYTRDQYDKIIKAQEVVGYLNTVTVSDGDY